MIAPHGGSLVHRYTAPAEVDELRRHAAGLRAVSLTPKQLSDAHMIAQGVFSPLEGFMMSADYREVLDRMHLVSGLPWSLPVTLPVDQSLAAGLREGDEVALADEAGRPVGVLALREAYTYDKVHEAAQAYGTQDETHPGVASLKQQGAVLLGGPVTLFEEPTIAPEMARHYRTPAETRREMERRGWQTMVGFQTRNPVHRAHEYIQKSALEIVDGLLLHPLVGETKADDIPADIRMRCYEALLEGYYPESRTLLSVYPAFMRYAGPREAIFHALARKNYGCTHFIVGRDHAGVGSFYGTYDAQQIFREFDPSALGITPLFFENAFYCKRCQTMATAKTCPHGTEFQVSLSGTMVRSMLAEGQLPPAEFTRPEVAQVLTQAMSGAHVEAQSPAR